jgi:hemerythrin-like metal-binding protein
MPSPNTPGDAAQRSCYPIVPPTGFPINLEGHRRHACNEAESSSQKLRPILYLTLRPFPTLLDDSGYPYTPDRRFRGEQAITADGITAIRFARALPGTQVVAGQGTREDVGKILSKLVNYTVFHFGAEEELFKDTDYPHTESHIKKHEELVQKVSTFQDEFAQNRTEVSDELLNFLTDWLIQHIHGTDRGYKDYI